MRIRSKTKVEYPYLTVSATRNRRPCEGLLIVYRTKAANKDAFRLRLRTNTYDEEQRRRKRSTTNTTLQRLTLT